MTSAMKLFFSSSSVSALRRGRFGGGARVAGGVAPLAGRGVARAERSAGPAQGERQSRGARR
ncbi:MAG: hypothetical protein OXU53_02065, partial [Deltaproteobacteria bacterium]|nr:hypothetical protein [Deltaproteobacteria bacterium]